MSHEPGANSPRAQDDEPLKLDDFGALARERLPAAIFDYIACGACDESTIEANQRDLATIRLLPLCLRDVDSVNVAIELLRQPFRAPIGFGPTALHRLVHEQGEVATARAAKRLGIPFVVSSMASISLEEIARLSGNTDLWFQTYIFRDRQLTRDLVQRAKTAGYRWVVVTVGCPVPGKREANVRNRFSLPDDVVAANFGRNDVIVHNNPIHSVRGAELDPSATWDDIEWLRGTTELPVMLKGVMNPLDVQPALDRGIAGLIVSNHGGRQLDTSESTIRILPAFAEAVEERVPLLVDSGFRRGTDVLKALALGADAVLLGRPVLWALAVRGEEGVVDAANVLIEELRIAMQMAGYPDVESLRRSGRDIVQM
jgi:(S)-2-hydroxy-acid oxidase/4-hydroxymandelate oxidase